MSKANKKIMVAKARFSFNKGYNQLSRKDATALRIQLTEALGLNNRTSFYKRLNGDLVPKVTEVELIEKVFKKFGIINIWGK